MNGLPVSVLVWIINGLFGLLTTTVLIILKLHQKADDEHRRRIDNRLEQIAKRVHDLTAMIGEVKAEQYYRDKRGG